jgi:twitching motility two-component system response regulator PilH
VNMICVIAEDSPSVVHLLRTYAAMCGYKTAIASVGERVLELVQQQAPAVIVLNAELPGKTRGWETLQALKANSMTCRIPIVAFSLHADETQLLHTRGADAYVAMPLSFEEFRTAVEAAKKGLLST